MALNDCRVSYFAVLTRRRNRKRISHFVYFDCHVLVRILYASLPNLAVFPVFLRNVYVGLILEYANDFTEPNTSLGFKVLSANSSRRAAHTGKQPLSLLTVLPNDSHKPAWAEEWAKWVNLGGVPLPRV